jgi:hypothetical protein
MGFASTIIGGIMGIGVQLFSNAAKKVPLSRRTFDIRHLSLVAFTISIAVPRFLTPTKIFVRCIEPWIHLFSFTAGCYLGNIYPKKELELLQTINSKRAERGLPPMVGTNGWIRYEIPEDSA